MIKYAGVHTLLPTPAVEAFLNANLPPGLARYFFDPADGAEINGKGPFVPQLNWPKVFQPKINTLYWPSGASRWSVMLLVIDSSMAETIRLATSVASSASFEATGAQLVIADTTFVGTIDPDAWSLSDNENSVAMSTEMFAMRPHPVSVIDSSFTSEKTLWILPVVDIRFTWQWRNMEASPLTSSWACFDTLSTQLDIDPAIQYTTPSVEYGDGDPISDLERAPAAKVLDACCHQINYRFVRDIDGLCWAYDPTEALTEWDANLDSTRDGDPRSVWRRLAGGELSRKGAVEYPQKLKIIEGDEIREVMADDAGFYEYAPGTTKLIHTKYPSEANLDAEKDAYATKFATDWYKWRSKMSDESFIGLKAWHMTGFEDLLVISHGSLHESPSTRIVTLPPNFGIQDYNSSSKTPQCAHYFQISCGVGDITGSFGWTIRLKADDSVVGSGTYTFGTDTTSSLNTAVNAAVGSNVDFVGGPLPGSSLSIHLNRGLDYTKYVFEKSASTLTPQEVDWFAWVTVSSCCVVGG